MEITTNSQYSFNHRYKGEVNLTLFNQYYLEVSETRLKKARNFKLEVAILNPKPIHVSGFAFKWLAAALIAGVTDIFLIKTLLTSTESSETTSMAMLIAIAVATLLTAVFGGLFLLKSQHKWVLKTRTSHYPLIEVPYLRKDKAAAKQFVERIVDAINKDMQFKEFTPDTLMAGEMRLLRRLAEKKILSSKSYDKAKKKMLKKAA